MIKKLRYTVSSTHLDSQGYMMTLEALESMKKQINGTRKARLGLEHIRTFPPFGAITNADIIIGSDGHHYLEAEMMYFDSTESIQLTDGTKLIKQSFSIGEYPFIEGNEKELTNITISTDHANFNGNHELDSLYKRLKQEVEIGFTTEEIGRKSEISDPEIIVSITTAIAIGLRIIKSKALDKLGDAVGEDLAKFYKLLSRLAIETIKRAQPANRPKNFVISYPNDQCSIELVISTTTPDKVLFALQKEKLNTIAEKKEMLQNLNPEKIQFVFNKDNSWEFNYLLTRTGATIGVEKAFRKRNELYNKILEEQNKSSS